VKDPIKRQKMKRNSPSYKARQLKNQKKVLENALNEEQPLQVILDTIDPSDAELVVRFRKIQSDSNK
jgi:hypothetical protein